MLFRLLLPRLRPYRNLLVLLVALQLVQTLSSLALPALNAGVIDHGVLRGDTGRVLSGGARMAAVTLLQVAAGGGPPRPAPTTPTVSRAGRSSARGSGA
ncbi:ABC transporter ATP-binding protein, partial [Streptomyces sp. NPDC057242]